MRAISLSLVVNDAIASRLQKEMTAAYHHDHSHRTKSRSANQRRLTATLVLVLFYMAAEVIGGLLSGSLALLADAGHMLSDAGSLALALFAMWLASRPSGSQHTYGYYRTEILAALVNGATLVAISILIFTEAYQRLMNPPEVHAGIMMVVASGPGRESGGSVAAASTRGSGCGRLGSCGNRSRCPGRADPVASIIS